MHQAWVTMIGLGLDILGFVLIVWEWRRAHYETQHIFENEITELLEGRPVHKGMRSSDGSILMDESEFSELIKLCQVRQHDASIRIRIFFLGAALVFLGFSIQILGAWPGGIQLIGLLP